MKTRLTVSVLRSVAALAIVGLIAGSAVAAPYVETFDTGNAGWLIGYGTNFAASPAVWSNAGGNPGGYISGSANDLYAVWTYDPAPFGDMNGMTITIDTMVTDGAAGTAQFYVGRGGTYFIDGTWSITDNASWTTHQSELNSTNFVPWTGQNDHMYTLEEVLAAPTDVGIFFGGGLASGAGTLNVDNYGVVPEPATMSLLALGGLAILRRRK